MKKLMSLMKNQDGNFSMMFGICSAMLATGVAVAIDISGMQKFQSDLQTNLDIAAIAAVAQISMGGETVNGQGLGNTPDSEAYKKIVLDIMAENGFDLKGVEPNVVLKDGLLNVQANVPYNLQFGNILGRPNTNVDASSHVVLPGGGAPVEVALVLDNTESMNFDGKMTALKQGARDFISSIEDTNSGSRIALVPFARYARIDTKYESEFWLDVPTEYDTPRLDQRPIAGTGMCHMEPDTRFEDGVEVEFEREICTGQSYETITTTIESRWKGCVGVRPNRLHLKDDSYNTMNTRIPALLHRVPREVNGFGYDERSWCPRVITPLTDDYSLLDNEIGHLYGTDRTFIPMGLIWGQRVLSPQPPFNEADTVAPKRQIMVLMSDGENTAQLRDGDEHESIPYVRELKQYQLENGVIASETNADTATLCESIKDEGITIYTIAFQITNPATQTLMRNCASSPGHYFDAGNNQALVASFASISDELEDQIRLMR